MRHGQPIALGEAAGAERNVRKRPVEPSGGWRRKDRKAECMKQRDLPGAGQRPAGVRAFIVATKRSNVRGAKGRRKMDDE